MKDDIFASTDIDCQWTILSDGDPVELKILYMNIFETFDCDPYFLAVFNLNSITMLPQHTLTIISV